MEAGLGRAETVAFTVTVTNYQMQRVRVSGCLTFPKCFTMVKTNRGCNVLVDLQHLRHDVVC